MRSGRVSSNLPVNSADSLARGLGWFSIGLGLAEVLAPRTLARTLGMKGSETVLAGYGLREITTGIGVLSAADPAPWIWGRVGGDVLDVGTLTTGLAPSNPRRGAVGVALATVVGVTALDVLCGMALSAKRRQQSRLTRWDYSGRRGMPKPPEAMRGAARDFKIPRDMRTPDLLRAYPGD